MIDDVPKHIRLSFDGPVLTAGAVKAIAILREVGWVKDGDCLTPARLCKLLGCEPDKDGCPPESALPASTQQKKFDARDAAVDLLIDRLYEFVQAKGGLAGPWCEALTIVGASCGQFSGMSIEKMVKMLRSAYGATEDKEEEERRRAQLQ